MDEYIRKFKKAMINVGFTYIDQIGKLYDYYVINLEAINAHFNKVKEEAQASFKILELFDYVYDGKEEKEMQKRVEEIKKVFVDDKHQIQDIFSLLSIGDNNSLSFRFNEKISNYSIYHPVKARKAMMMNEFMLRTLTSSVLSSIVSGYESFLSIFYSNLIYHNQPLYFGSRTVSFQDILKRDINKIIESETNSIVEADMYDSLSTTRKILEKEKIDMRTITEMFDKFKETYYRRNIYIHNDGHINEMYLKNVSKSTFKNRDEAKCNIEYIKSSIINTQCLITYMVFRIVEKENFADEDIDALLDFYFEKLANTEYLLSSFAHKLISNCRKLDFNIKMIAEVNYLISLKEMGNKVEFDKELLSFDVTAAETQFKIAKLILEEKFEAATRLIEESYDKSSTPNQLLNWPLYCHYRKTKYYKELIKKHHEDFASEQLMGDDQH